MEKSTVVLVDATQYGSDPAIVRVIEREYPLVYVTKQDDLGRVYETQAAAGRVITCFDFDFPDIASLSVLSEAKQQFASVPMLMFTEQHSEALAVWALRTRIWDYFVKPVVDNSVTASLDRLNRLLTESSGRAPRRTISHKQPLPDDARFQKHRGEDKAVEVAAAYIDQHLAEKLMQTKIAELCGTNSYQLSRAFKRVYGITFQEYILRRRIEKATELLRNNSASVIDVCWAVGFHDASYFTKMFQRHTGMTPSGYRHKWMTSRKEATLPFQLSTGHLVKL
ncbi:AraC family transcriptional regulator [Marinobacter orientalis]|uniref:DNA-binding response regulator n=1 Tax=Marinobacter orientalis TaxID=1928859 RepID=A0A7Y0RBB7_9GAMM|nr:DNA-binding response regulator [Marinobacter orientalis]NMT63088.1 DNA-binding response regulator [Marinobacter orientalis]